MIIRVSSRHPNKWDKLKFIIGLLESNARGYITHMQASTRMGPARAGQASSYYYDTTLLDLYESCPCTN